jgi:hypothetical protein
LTGFDALSGTAMLIPPCEMLLKFPVDALKVSPDGACNKMAYTPL